MVNPDLEKTQEFLKVAAAQTRQTQFSTVDVFRMNALGLYYFTPISLGDLGPFIGLTTAMGVRSNLMQSLTILHREMPESVQSEFPLEDILKFKPRVFPKKRRELEIFTNGNHHQALQNEAKSTHVTRITWLHPEIRDRRSQGMKAAWERRRLAAS